MGVAIIKINNCIPERHNKSDYVYDLDIIDMSPLRPEKVSYKIHDDSLTEEVKALLKRCDVVDVATDIKTGLGGGYLGMCDAEFESVYPFISFYTNGTVLLWKDKDCKREITSLNSNRLNSVIRKLLLEMD